MAMDVREVVAKNLNLTKGSKVLVGVSGGVDSIVLAEIIQSLGYSIAIAHCHFNLRGIDADLDQQFSEQFAKNLNVPFFTTKFETDTYAKTRKVSIQMAARDLRYYWFEKLCKEHDYAQIAVGTHLSDNIETFLFNASKGTGLSGLRGIKPKNGKVIRPLLSVSKDDIYTYAKENSLEWREDLSNKSIKYHRNKIRHKVVPVLKEINPGLENTFQRNFENLARVDAFVQKEIESVWKRWLKVDGKGWKIAIEDIKGYDFADVVLNYKLKPFGFNSVQVKNILGTLNGQPGAIVSSVDHRAYLDREFVFIQQKRFFTLPEEFKITEFLGEINSPIKLMFKDYHIHDVVIEKLKNIAYLDFDLLHFPLTLRKWRAGDKIAPFGMKGMKKVSDLLIDEKIPKHIKEDIWVVESNAEICWVVGIRASEKFRVTLKTKRVYRLIKLDA